MSQSEYDKIKKIKIKKEKKKKHSPVFQTK